MEFKRINRSTPETVFVTMQNNTGSSAPIGMSVGFDVTTSMDGVKFRQLATDTLHTFAGIVPAAIADQAFGLVQVYGLCAAAIVLTTNTTMSAGAMLVPVAAQNYLSSSATTQASSTSVSLLPHFAFLAESVVTSNVSMLARVFVRAL